MKLIVTGMSGTGFWSREEAEISGNAGLLRLCHPLYFVRSRTLPTTSPMITQVQQEFETLIMDLTGPATEHTRADEVELPLFGQLLALGARLLQVHFDARSALRWHDRRSRRYLSIFGTLSIRRDGYRERLWATGQGPPTTGAKRNEAGPDTM